MLVGLTGEGRMVIAPLMQFALMNASYSIAFSQANLNVLPKLRTRIEYDDIESVMCELGVAANHVAFRKRM